MLFFCLGLWSPGSKVARKAPGLFHGKAVVVDRRRLYTGGANVTYSSNFNEEFCFLMTGPVVEQVLGKLAVHRQKGKAWKGS